MGNGEATACCECGKAGTVKDDQGERYCVACANDVLANCDRCEALIPAEFLCFGYGMDLCECCASDLGC